MRPLLSLRSLLGELLVLVPALECFASRLLIIPLGRSSLIIPPPRNAPLLLAHVLIGAGDQRMESVALFFSASVSSPLGGGVAGRPAFCSPSSLPSLFRSSILTRVWMSVLPAYPYFRFYAFVDLSITNWDHVCCCSLGVSRIRCIFRLICKSLTLHLCLERIAAPIFLSLRRLSSFDS